MKRHIVTLSLLVLTAPLFAQEAPASAASERGTVVATVNGEVITKARLDQLWSRIGEKSRRQYEASGGGKRGFLDNYIRKRLVLQKAVKGGFDQQPAVQAELEAAKEAALFDAYVREVIAASVVTETDIRAFYDVNREQFTIPETAKVRVLTVSTEERSAVDARELIGGVMSQLNAQRAAILGSGGGTPEVAERFAAAARLYSDAPSAERGGDLGWIGRGALAGRLGEAAFLMKPGSISGMLEADGGLHLIMVEDRREGAIQPYDSARAGIREYLLATNTGKVVEKLNALTGELAASADVMIFADEIE